MTITAQCETVWTLFLDGGLTMVIVTHFLTSNYPAFKLFTLSLNCIFLTFCRILESFDTNKKHFIANSYGT